MEDAWGNADAGGGGAARAAVAAPASPPPPPPPSLSWRPALRVLQLDASRLDRLLVDMLRRQLVAAVEPLGWAVSEQRQQDVTAALSAALYVLTVARTGATYGQRLLNLRYARGGAKPSRRVTWLHFFCVVVAPWLWHRAHGAMSEVLDEDTARQWIQIARRVDTLTVVARYLNHVAFLWRGAYLSLADRVCGMESVFDKDLPRRITYDFLTRELLWHGFSEFAVFVLPYIDLRKLWAVATSFLYKPAGPEGENGAVVLIPLDARCAVCGAAPPWTPHTAACCEAVYCYHCVSALAHDAGRFDCKRCYTSVPSSRIRPCRAAVLDSSG